MFIVVIYARSLHLVSLRKSVESTNAAHDNVFFAIDDPVEPLMKRRIGHI